jgi:hypothetical protein
MKRMVLAVLLLSLLTPFASSNPEITYDRFYQQELQDGEMITFGLQFEDSGSDVTHAVASLDREGREVDFTPLLDRNEDDFYAGELGPVKGGNTYTVEIKGCNADGGCVTETYLREASCRIGVFGSCVG